MSAQWTEDSRFEMGIGPNQLQSKAQPESLWAKKVVAFLLTIFSMFRGTNCCKGRMANVRYIYIYIYIYIYESDHFALSMHQAFYFLLHRSLNSGRKDFLSPSSTTSSVLYINPNKCL